ncbi:unnamed protein product [Echinostoma caproni]|uniref:Uncharacterized protein n=1 Tax=Echinostoma caproni TaxID=27848 RepID=A0A183BFC5_9TREM|nr:unnamed protein product [Echinostoma caproni]
MVPPTQLLAQLRRILQSAASNATRPRNSVSRRPDGTKRSSRVSSDSHRRSAKPTLDALTRIREGSPFNDGPGSLPRPVPASPSDSEMTSDTEEDEDEDEDDDDDDDDDDQDQDGDGNGDEEGAVGNAGVMPSSTNLAPTVSSIKDCSTGLSSTAAKDVKSLLDFSPDSSANKQLLGAWSRCPLLMDMLYLAYELLLVRNCRTSQILFYLELKQLENRIRCWYY